MEYGDSQPRVHSVKDFCLKEAVQAVYPIFCVGTAAQNERITLRSAINVQN